MAYENIARAVQDPNGCWRQQPLFEHLKNVSRLSGEFAAEFGNRDWGEVLGLWHDLGKYHPKWQKYIRLQTGFDPNAQIECGKGKINHSTAGAVQAFLRMRESPPARILAYVLAGHHAGLPDWDPDDAGGDLTNRLYPGGSLGDTELNEIREMSEAKSLLEARLPASLPLGLIDLTQVMKSKEHFHLWIRMLFSCLVDADYLDTEQFMNPTKSGKRHQYLGLSELKERFDRYILRKESTALDTSINQHRRNIHQKCLQKSGYRPGFFSLTVPTGGGKTLSSMAFALSHALAHGKRRIIYAIPYTSIIEQTAQVFKFGTDLQSKIDGKLTGEDCLFGENQVLEHHSQVIYQQDDSPSKLACENWDAPIIVTTNVQLFESLFAAKTSRCRKLHNIANSVIILDEVQMLPPDYLRPLLSILRGLVQHFGVTVVLMTATQPVLEGKISAPPNEFQGLTDLEPIIDNIGELEQAFDRVELRMPATSDEASSWESIRNNLLEHEQVLCIVNSRKDCHDLHAIMPDGTLHLSALMCPEERSYLISDIKAELQSSLPLRVISTQLVEAGVDIDFPVVYRAMAGFDSIAQAAGRCNRENRMARNGLKGNVVVFNPPHPAPRGLLRKGEETCRELLRLHPKPQLTSQIFSNYFKKYYESLNNVDKPGFQNALVREAAEFKFQFRTFSRNFQLIDDDYYHAIIVRYENPGTGHSSNPLIAMLHQSGHEQWLQRKLQRFMVNIPFGWLDHFRDSDMIEQISGYWVQKSPLLYQPGIGVQMEHDIIAEQLIL